MKPETMVVSDPPQEEQEARPKRLALIVSKGTLDQAYPPLVMATTAASMGWEVGIFFTFYGLDIVHKERMTKLSVSPIGNPAMPPPLKKIPMHIPTLVGALPGMKSAATKMMKSWMSKANLVSIPELLDIARELDVRMFACNTTLVVMDGAKEDLIEGVEFAGAPAFLDFAGDSDVQLFI
ncbi:MAG TPA: DsrE/DsrF/DrsH-like family protein [Actinomycetota bacterium]|nr:DsrE/DsrF/DrsH-like family protein [Actinomycetota bacterium]